VTVLCSSAACDNVSVGRATAILRYETDSACMYSDSKAGRCYFQPVRFCSYSYSTKQCKVYFILIHTPIVYVSPNLLSALVKPSVSNKRIYKRTTLDMCAGIFPGPIVVPG
jgi:hypothetical protein